MPLRRVSVSSVGQNSDSTQIAKLGRQWLRKRRTAPGESIGTYWCTAPAGRRSSRIAAAVRVTVVKSTELAGERCTSALTKGRTEVASPTLAAWNQTRWPTGRDKPGWPNLSPIRAASSRPSRARRCKRIRHAGSASVARARYSARALLIASGLLARTAHFPPHCEPEATHHSAKSSVPLAARLYSTGTASPRVCTQRPSVLRNASPSALTKRSPSQTRLCSKRRSPSKAIQL